MITLRRNAERRHVRQNRHEVWFTFLPREGPDSPGERFGVLTMFSEMRFPPGGGHGSRPQGEAETVTYVYRGALAQSDSTGRSGVLHAGEFQRATVGCGVRYKETNASRSEWTHIFRISLRPWEAGVDGVHEQKRFPIAQRHHALCVVASPDGRKGSLRILQDAFIYSSVLDPGHHLIHELLPGRSVWLHVICGEATMQDIVLTQGDGVGVTVSPVVSLTAQVNTEMLLVDMGATLDRFQRGVVPG